MVTHWASRLLCGLLDRNRRRPRAVLDPNVHLGRRQGRREEDLYDDDDEENKFDPVTDGMSARSRREYEMRQMDKEIEYANVNPLMAKAMENQLAGLPEPAVQKEAPTLLTLEEQIELQNTVQELMSEIQSLKKRNVQLQQEAAAQHPSVEKKKGKKVKKHVGEKSPSRTQGAAAEEGDQGERPRARSEFEMSNPMAGLASGALSKSAKKKDMADWLDDDEEESI